MILFIMAYTCHLESIIDAPMPAGTRNAACASRVQGLPGRTEDNGAGGNWAKNRGR